MTQIATLKANLRTASARERATYLIAKKAQDRNDDAFDVLMERHFLACEAWIDAYIAYNASLTQQRS